MQGCWRWARGAAALAALGLGCASEGEPAEQRAVLSGACLLNSDCEAPLVCAYERCHQECRSSRDCPAGRRCIVAERPLRVCQLPDDRNCSYNSQCPPGLVCAVDRQCRSQCQTFQDCVPGQECAGGTCADAAELVDGGLPVLAPPSSGAACIYHSDCPLPLACLDGKCRIECLEDRDCVPGFVCEESRCGPPRRGGGGGAAGGGGEGGVVDAGLDAGSAGAGGAGFDGGTGRDSGPGNDGGPRDSAGDAGAGGARDAGAAECETQPIGAECAPAPPATAVGVSAGASHTCVLLDTGAIRCWGIGFSGQLGYGSTANIGDDEAAGCGGDVSVGGTVIRLGLGEQHTCAVLTGGSVRCWGHGGNGRLGYGNTQSVGDASLPSSVDPVSLPRAAIDVCGGLNHSCAVLDDGSVYCWGGLGDTYPYGLLPTEVAVGAEAQEVHCGRYHTCILTTAGAVRCWGESSSGELGYAGTAGHAVPPGDVDVGAAVVELSVGLFHACARLETGAVRCWGSGGSGRLGYGDAENVGDDETPASAGDVPVGEPVLRIAAGGAHTCALLSGGRVRCWGSGADGRLGHGGTELVTSAATAEDVEVGGEVQELALAASHTCALLDGGGVRCWGLGSLGQLGYGNTCTVGDAAPPASAGDVPYR